NGRLGQGIPAVRPRPQQGLRHPGASRSAAPARPHAATPVFVCPGARSRLLGRQRQAGTLATPRSRGYAACGLTRAIALPLVPRANFRFAEPSNSASRTLVPTASRWARDALGSLGALRP